MNKILILILLLIATQAYGAAMVLNPYVCTSPLNCDTFTISCNTASGSQSGCLSSTDWTTFNSKAPAFGTLTNGNLCTTNGTTVACTTTDGHNNWNDAYSKEVTTWTAPLAYSSGTASCNVASGTQAGCLSSTDWTTFNNKVSYPLLNFYDSQSVSRTFQSHAMVYTHGFLFVADHDGGSYPIGLLYRYNPNDLTSSTTQNFGGTSLYSNMMEMVYDSNRDKIYIYHAGASFTTFKITEVNPDTLAYTTVISQALSNTNNASITTDGTSLYVVTYTNPAVVYKYLMSNWSLTSTTTLTGVSNGHNIKYDSSSGYLYVTGQNSSGAPVAKINPGTMTFSTMTFPSGYNATTDDLAFTTDYVWVGFESVGGYIGVIKKNDLSYQVLSLGAAGSWGYYSLYFDGSYVWAGAYDATFSGLPGKLIQIDPNTTAYNIYSFPANYIGPNEIVSDGSHLFVTTWESPTTLTRFYPPLATQWRTDTYGINFDATGTLKHIGIGVASTVDSGVLLSPTVSSTTAPQYGVTISPILVAHANSSYLYGLNINPTFNDGSYSGVTHTSLKVTGDATVTGATTVGSLTCTGSPCGGGGAPGGSDTQVQFNDGGTTFGGDTALTWNKTDNILTLGGSLRLLETGSTPTYYTKIQSGDITGADITLTLPVTTSTLVSESGSATFTNKTYDANGTGNVLKQTGYITLPSPHKCDGSGAVMQVSDATLNYFGQGLFSATTAKASNYCEYRLTVPADIDTAVDLKVVTWTFQLSGADTGSHQYYISSSSVAASAAYAGSLADEISLAFAGDASGTTGDVEYVTNTTLTGWKSALTAGQLWVIRIARDGGAGGDTSTVASYSGPLTISYGKKSQ